MYVCMVVLLLFSWQLTECSVTVTHGVVVCLFVYMVLLRCGWVGVAIVGVRMVVATRCYVDCAVGGVAVDTDVVVVIADAVMWYGDVGYVGIRVDVHGCARLFVDNVDIVDMLCCRY